MKQKDLLKMIQEMSSNQVVYKIVRKTLPGMIMKLHLIHSILEFEKVANP